MMHGVPLLVTGAEGRIGRLLRAVWGDAPIWSARHAGPGLLGWDILADPPPPLPEGLVILHLAGATRGPNMAQAADLARAVCRAGVRARRILLASSVAVYRPGDGDSDEDARPAPATPYARAKLQMEEAAFEMQAQGGPPVTCLRIANVVGADGLLGAAVPGRTVVLDPVPGWQGGPVRSYIGPRALAQVLAALTHRAAVAALPAVLNVALPPPLPMAALLDAAGLDWRHGPPNPDVVPRLSVATGRLAALVPLPHTDAARLVADWRSVTGPLS